MKACKIVIVNGEKISFEEIYKKYYNQMFAYFFKRLNNKADAEDLTSDTLLYCYKNIDTYDSEKASFATWIYLIAKSRYYNYFRDRKLTENIDDFENIAGDSENQMENAIYIDELRKQLNIALNNLTERQRSIIIMKFFEDKTTEEIADFYKTSSNNIRVQLCKALKNLRKYMPDWR